MELQEDGEAEGTPFEDLAERVRGTHEDDEDIWASLAEDAEQDGDFYRGGDAGSQDVSQELQRLDENGDQQGPNDGVPDIHRSESADSAEGNGALPSPDADPTADDPLEELIDPDDDRLDPRDARRVGDSAEEYVVPKDGYCEACPYFSDPPDVGCTNDGTEIVEFEDMNHVRVRDCPKVAEERVASNGG